jgi:ATP-dependent DNA helicase RecQ
VLLYRPADRSTQVYFLNRGQVREDDVRLLARCLPGPTDEHQPLEAVAEVCDLSEVRARAILATMERLGLAARETVLAGEEGDEPRVLYSTTREFEDADLDALVEHFAEHRRRDEDRLREMEVYAQTALCRWNRIRAYFEDYDDEDSIEPCGHCDSCDEPVSEALVPPPEAPRDLETLPVERLGDPGVGGVWTVGDRVKVPTYGEGVVEEIAAGGALGVRFEEDGLHHFPAPPPAAA